MPTRSSTRSEGGELIHVLRIEIDGHFHGSSDVPQPWVAQIVGPHPRYGLERNFVELMKDWRSTRRAWSGNVYGVVATFALRSGSFYEVSRLRGKSSKRHLVREFLRVEDGQASDVEAEEVLDSIDGNEPGTAVTLAVDDVLKERISEVVGVGTPRQLAWISASGRRKFRVVEGRVYEIADGVDRRFVRIECGIAVPATEAEVLGWLHDRAR